MITAAPAGRLGLANFTGATFTEMLLTYWIPLIERTYRVLAGRENRAMAGLSMGGMRTFLTTLSNLDKFAYIGASAAVRAGEEARSIRRPPTTVCSGIPVPSTRR